jgi:hypothetical protein
MKKIFLLLIGVVLFLNACKSNPFIYQEDQPGNRDYVWNVDTINACNPIYRLWGKSPSNILAITELCNDDIFHFDGLHWITGGKYIIPYTPYSIYGFSDNNVYLGAAYGRIFHFDGNKFSEVAALSKDEHNNIVFENIWGESSDDFYAFGAYPDEKSLFNNSVIAHYTNNNWNILDTGNMKGNIAQLFKDKTFQTIYLQSIKPSETYDSTFIYEYNQGKFSKLYSTEWGINWADISLINNHVYFVLNKKIAIRINNQFQTILDLESTKFYEHIWGRNSKDIFLEMMDGLAHYNGTDIEYLFYFNKQPRTQIWDAVIFDKEVFFLVYEDITKLSLIYHGKLKD